MKPCCLSVRAVSDESECQTRGNLLGGASGYRTGACPVTAEEAADAIKLARQEEGCYFSIGHGAMMKPCCLQTQQGVEEIECKANARLGGAAGFHRGSCPSAASEAAAFLANKSRGSDINSVAPLVAMAPMDRRQQSQPQQIWSAGGVAFVVPGFVLSILAAGAFVFSRRPWRRVVSRPLLQPGME